MERLTLEEVVELVEKVENWEASKERREYTGSIEEVKVKVSEDTDLFTTYAIEIQDKKGYSIVNINSFWYRRRFKKKIKKCYQDAELKIEKRKREERKEEIEKNERKRLEGIAYIRSLLNLPKDGGEN